MNLFNRKSIKFRREPKIFCIGFHKTGTTSLRDALRILGYSVTGPNGNKDPDIESNVMELISELVDQFDAFQDNPWPILYKELDKKYPLSRFILTLRDEKSWMKSQLSHFGSEETPMRRWIYGVGCPEGNEQVYTDRFRAHYREVIEYFEGRSDDLLVLNLAEGDGWQKLCPFLGKKIPKDPFPHSNSADKRLKSNPAANKESNNQP